jgi:hypothetical protein
MSEWELLDPHLFDSIHYCPASKLLMRMPFLVAYHIMKSEAEIFSIKLRLVRYSRFPNVLAPVRWSPGIKVRPPSMFVVQQRHSAEIES